MIFTSDLKSDLSRDLWFAFVCSWSFRYKWRRLQVFVSNSPQSFRKDLHKRHLGAFRLTLFAVVFLEFAHHAGDAGNADFFRNFLGHLGHVLDTCSDLSLDLRPRKIGGPPQDLSRDLWFASVGSWSFP